MLFSLERIENDELFYAIYTIAVSVLLGFFEKSLRNFQKNQNLI